MTTRRLGLAFAMVLVGGCGSSSDGGSGTSGTTGGAGAGGGASGGASSGGASSGGAAAGGSTSGGAGGVAQGGSGGVAQGGSGGTSQGGSSQGGQGGGGQMTGALCFADQADGPIARVDYDALGAQFSDHCFGTSHQDIQGVERVVVLGDSISHGTFPTPSNMFWANQFKSFVEGKFPGVEFQNCAKDGAQTDDLESQINDCFPSTESRKTLTVFTMGGNDLKSFAGDPLAPSKAAIDQSVANLDAAVARLTDPSEFPGGSYVIFANTYEYTDMTTNMSSCATAGLIGLSGSWPEGAPAIMYMHEGYINTAVKYGVDMVFMQEHFCGHGFAAGDANGQCYRGPGSENWFDVSCIHPTPTGHTQITGLFKSVVGL